MVTVTPASSISIDGATVVYEKRIRTILDALPAWYVRAANLARVVVTNRPDVRQQVAMFEHGSRILWITPGVGDMLRKAIAHECAHGIDDNEGQHHRFSSTDEWKRIHANQSHFEIQKYEDEPLEYFADMVAKVMLLGAEKMRTTNPDEVSYVTTWVFPTLQKEQGQ